MEIDTKYNLDIGEVKIIKNPNEVVWTILGSCISVIFYVNSNLSLICHAQSPSPNEGVLVCTDTCPCSCFSVLPEDKRFKYVSCSLQYMINHMKRHKVNLNLIKTSLIGGAAALKATHISCGEINVEKAKEILKAHKIRIHREIVGGNSGYTIWYHARNNKLTYKLHNSKEIIEAQI